MADAVPSAASIIMHGKPRWEGQGTLDMPALSVGFGHRNEQDLNL
jgi:hypothetical protein